MLRKIDWGSEVGRRIKLRDLHVFFTVAQHGSMGKAAAKLGVTTPTVSDVIADLEAAIGVKLLDRNTRGVEPTIYRRAVLKRGLVAFDELKQCIRDIEFLADPTVGELRIGCPESVSSAILQPIIEKFKREYPRVVLHVEDANNFRQLELPALRERKLDLVFARLIRPPRGDPLAEDLNFETLFNEELAVAVGMHSAWARRRKTDLADLVNEPWILTPPGTWTHSTLAEAFQSRGLKMPELGLVTFSVHLRANLLANGTFVSAFPASFLSYHAGRFSLKVLPLKLSARTWPLTIVTLKSRTLSPVVERFIKCACEITKPLAPGR